MILLKDRPAKTRIPFRSQERLRIYQRFVGAGVLPSKVRQDLLAGEENHNHCMELMMATRNPANSPVEGKVVYPHYLLKVLGPSKRWLGMGFLVAINRITTWSTLAPISCF